MIVSLEDAKSYLRVDYEDDDVLITGLILTSENLCADTLRRPFSDDDLIDSVIRTAVLFGVAYLFENRENARMDNLTKMMRYILSTKREEAF